MWRPGFDFLERRNARLVGAHRALCVYSFVHRGSPEKPGLVLGLDRGGNCRGIAYRVASDLRTKTIEYLRSREQVTRVYREAWRRVWIDDDPQKSVHALCYVVDRGHRQYAGQLSLADQLHYARQGHGRSGPCRDYVLAAVKELGTLGIQDNELQVLAERLRGVHEIGIKLTRLTLPLSLTDSYSHAPLRSGAPSRFQGRSAAAQRTHLCRDREESDQGFQR